MLSAQRIAAFVIFPQGPTHVRHKRNLHPQPIAVDAQRGNAYWLASLTLSNPLTSAVLRPYDGQHVIGNASLSRRVTADTSKDAAAAAVVSAVLANVARLSGKSAAPVMVTLSEADPLSAVPLVASFADKSTYRVRDVMVLLATDSTASAAYAQVISYLAGKL